MYKALLFDFSRVILFPKDSNYLEELNKLHRNLSGTPDYNFLDHFRFNEDLLTYLEGIKDKCDLYIFTSGSIQDAPEVKQRIRGIFKSVYSAEGLGLSKKEPDSYLKIAEMIGVRPSEILFIDDSGVNVSAAKQADLNAMVYKDWEDLGKKISEALNAAG